MPKTLQLRRGTTAEITANTPASGELFVDTQKKTVTVGDGSTAGGIILARDDRVSVVFTTANGANGLASGAYNQANVTIGIDTTQNTRINSIETINTNQNNSITIIQGVDSTQNTRLNSIETINTNQNTTITAVNQFAAGAFNQANTAVSGLSSKQDTLVSGTNIKTINGTSLLGSGNIPVSGGGSTGDWTFTANVANVSFNDAAQISTSGNVTVDTRATTNYVPANWNGGGSSLTVVPKSPTTATLQYTHSIAGANFAELLNQTPIGATITYTPDIGTPVLVVGIVTLVTRSGAASGDVFLDFDIVSGPDPITVTTVLTLAITTGQLVTSNVSGTYIFETDGTFITDSVLAGDVLIANNIVTPLPIVTVDPYGNVTQTPQPLVINGNLSVTGNVTSNNMSTRVAIGSSAGLTNQNFDAVAVGPNAGETTQGAAGVAIGAGAGRLNQGGIGVAIGYFAALSAQGTRSIAIGNQAAQTTQSTDAVAIGTNAGQTTQGESSVAVGNAAGQQNQARYGIAIGNSAAAGGQGEGSIAIGLQSGFTSQGTSSVAVGSIAGYSAQGTKAVAVGFGAGGQAQGINSVAIGNEAAADNQGNYSVAIGAWAGETSQSNNSIILNATGSNLNQTTANTFTVKPIRNVASATLPSGFFNMAYNPTTGEIIYWS